MCYYEHYHDEHRTIEIEKCDNEFFKKENLLIENELKELNENCNNILLVKNKLYEKINDLYEKTTEKLENSCQEKIEKARKEKEELQLKLNTEVTKIKIELEKCLSEIDKEIRIKIKINKGIERLNGINQNNLLNLNYLSKINKSIKKMKRINWKLMKNINISYEEDKNNIKYEEYYFNGIPVPQIIKIENLNSTGGKISWDIDNINLINKDFDYLYYIIELRKEEESFKKIFQNAFYYKTYAINNLESNTNYEIRICSQIGDTEHCSEWSKIYKFKTQDYKGSIILKKSNKENELMKQLKEWIKFKDIELLFRAKRDGMTHNNFYSKCNDQGSNIVLIKNKKGNIFGGYSSISWDNKDKQKDHFYAKDSFLFTLTNIYNSEPKKFPSTGNYEIRNYKNCGPAFGGGTDLGIGENRFDLCGKGWAYFPHTFIDVDKKFDKRVFTGDLDNNNILFDVQEVEVFKIIN